VRIVNANGGGGGRQTATIAARQRVNSLLETKFLDDVVNDLKSLSLNIVKLFSRIMMRNFRTLKQAIDDFSTDATRFSLADAGDEITIAIICFVKLLNLGSTIFRQLEMNMSGMNRGLLLWTRLVAPVCPHYSENLLTKQSSGGSKKAFDLKLPFGEIEVLKENLELIKRQISLEHVEVLSIADLDAAIKAGRYASLLKQSPPSPGSPTSIFLTKEEEWHSTGNMRSERQSRGNPRLAQIHNSDKVKAGDNEISNTTHLANVDMVEVDDKSNPCILYIALWRLESYISEIFY
nr:leucine--tRNA ligase, cytoplasmic-like [Tanacetum cinerariifolium]